MHLFLGYRFWECTISFYISRCTFLNTKSLEYVAPTRRLLPFAHIYIYIYVYISNTVHINIINICITYNHIGWIIGCISVPASWRIHIKQKRGTSSKLKDCYWDRDTAKPTTKSNQIPKLLVVEQRIHVYSLPEKIPSQKERIVFQPSFFRGKLLVSGRVTTPTYQWLFLVPVKGGRDYITPHKARTISGILPANWGIII